MKTKKKLIIGERCFVHRPDEVFAGTVIDIYQDRVRVMGGTPTLRYDEWFPISSEMLTVEPA